MKTSEEFFSLSEVKMQNTPVLVMHLTVHRHSANTVRTGEIFQGLLPKYLVHETPVTH